MARALIVAAFGLWLAGCSTTNGTFDLFGLKNTGAGGDPLTTGTVPPSPEAAPVDDASLLGGDPTDDLALGKKYFRVGNFGMAERYFRRAAEVQPRDAEVWLGLAATYDRMRRFDLADRAYEQAISIIGPTVAILNNQGYSYMLRGDYKRARATLLVAQRKDPNNKFVQNNLQLLSVSESQGKTVQ